MKKVLGWGIVIAIFLGLFVGGVVLFYPKDGIFAIVKVLAVYTFTGILYAVCGIAAHLIYSDDHKD